jgi:hypothetical protein
VNIYNNEQPNFTKMQTIFIMENLFNAIDETSISSSNGSELPKKTNNLITNHNRDLFISSLENGLSITQTAKTFKLQHSTISKIKKNFETTGIRTKFSRGGSLSSSKPNEEQTTKILEWIREKCTRTLHQLEVLFSWNIIFLYPVGLYQDF